MSHKILIIDDDAVIRLVVKRSLNKMGYDIEVAKDGEEGWEKISQEKPDLVITDLMMPKLGGLDLLKRIRLDPATKELPVLCITGDEEGNTKQRAISLGATGWIQKPFHPETWGATLKKLLK